MGAAALRRFAPGDRIPIGFHAGGSKIYGRVLDAIGREADQAGRVLELPPDRLREAGLSWAKVEACRDLARHRLEGRLPARSEAERLSDAELIEAMTRIRGIGRWTVEMLLIFSLGRLTHFPSMTWYGGVISWHFAKDESRLRKNCARSGSPGSPIVPSPPGTLARKRSGLVRIEKPSAVLGFGDRDVRLL